MGFRPRRSPTVQDGAQFLIGRMVHYNNPIQAADRYFDGQLNVRLERLHGDPTLDFPWTLDETPNDGSEPERRDRVQQPDLADHRDPGRAHVPPGHLRLRADRRRHHAVPRDATGKPSQQVLDRREARRPTPACTPRCSRTARLTIVKQVVGTRRRHGPSATRRRRRSPARRGRTARSASRADGQRARNLTSGETVTVTETDPGDDRWTLTALTCTQIGANGQPEPRARCDAQPGGTPGGAGERPRAADPQPARHHVHVHQHLHARRRR